MGVPVQPGWRPAHYLAFEPSRRGQASKYIDLIQKGVPALDAAKQAFGDLKQLEKDLERYRGRDTLPRAYHSGHPC